MENENENGFDKLKILADQMARLGLNYQNLENITEENINSSSKNNNIDNTNQSIEINSNSFKVKKNSSKKEISKDNIEEINLNDYPKNDLYNENNIESDENKKLNDSIKSIDMKEKENFSKINEENNESKNYSNEENEDLNIENEEIPKLNNINEENKTTIPTNKYFFNEENQKINKLTNKIKNQDNLNTIKTDYSNENITTITPISTIKENNDNIINTNQVFINKENNEDDNNKIQYIALENEEDELFDTNITYYPSVTNNLKSISNKRKNIYEREMKHLKYKNKILDAKRQKLIQEENKLMKESPGLNSISDLIIQKKGKYIPLFERACQIHNQHLTNIILNEEKNKKQIFETENELLRSKNNKKYNKEDWENFIENQLKWKDDILYKRKVAKIYQDNKNDEIYQFKPKINNNTEKIIQRLNKENDYFQKDIFERLYNDKDEHEERQKMRDLLSLPSFQPKINKYKQKKNKGFNKYNSNKKIIIQETERRNQIEKENEFLMKKLNQFNNNNNSNQYLNNNNYENENEIPIQIINKNEKSFSVTPDNSERIDNLINEKKENRTNSVTSEEEIIDNDNENNKSENINNISISTPDIFKNQKLLEKLMKIENNKNDNKNDPEVNLYKLNIQNSTPIGGISDIIIPSYDYRDFFKKK